MKIRKYRKGYDIFRVLVQVNVRIGERAQRVKLRIPKELIGDESLLTFAVNGDTFR